MLAELALGFLFMVAWAFSYAFILMQKSTLRALFGVILLFGVMVLFNRYRFQGSLLGWFLGITLGFFVSLWLVQRYGPEKPTDESAMVVFLFGPLILAILLVLTLML